MRLSDYAASTNTPITTVRSWLSMGMPHRAGCLIDVDAKAVDEWRKTKLKRRGKPTQEETT